MASRKQALATFQHIMLENDICAETNNLTIQILNFLRSKQTSASNQIYLNTLLSLSTLNNLEEHVRIEGYFENIIPMYSMSDFQSHFRLERTTFESLMSVIHQQTCTVERLQYQ